MTNTYEPVSATETVDIVSADDRVILDVNMVHLANTIEYMTNEAENKDDPAPYVRAVDTALHRHRHG